MPGIGNLWRVLFVRNRHNWGLLSRFAIVGASGVVVNLATMIGLTLLGPDPESAVMRLFGSQFHVRWYHVFSVAAFVVANSWNFQLNRMWAFKSAGKTSWWQEYRAFITVGAFAQFAGLGLLTLLMHPGSPLALSPEFFDDSTPLLTRVYWAQLIMIAAITPVSFLLNKLWT